MKKISTYTVILTAIWVLLAAAVINQQNLAEHIIRIHILANSDSEADQAEKLEVRDAVLQVVSSRTAACSGRAEAAAVLRESAAEIGAIASAQCGKSVEVALSPEWYDTREYDAFSLPAGRYLSLQVKIGAAEGKNWWCVAFPAICTNAVSTDLTTVAVSGGMGEEDLHMMTDDTADVKVRYYLLEKIYEIYHALTAG